MIDMENQYLVSRCLTLLQDASGWLNAAEIAEKLRIPGQRETQRRVVRKLVERLRADNHFVLATPGGYYLTTDKALWQDYLDGRQIDAKRILGHCGRQKRMVADATGQGLLFCSAK
jgi:hypothetical protein